MSGVPLIADIEPRRPGVPRTVLKVRATDRCSVSIRTTLTTVFGTSTIPSTTPVSGSVTLTPLLFKITNLIPISTPSSDPTLRISSRALRIAATLPLIRPSSVWVTLAPFGLFNSARLKDTPVLYRAYVTIFEVAQMHAKLTHCLSHGWSTKIFVHALLGYKPRDTRFDG
jgi:hypothetical protein